MTPWILVPALLLLAATLIPLLIPGGAGAPSSARAVAVPLESLLATRGSPSARTTALLHDLETGLQELARARQATQAEREQLRRLGRRMNEVLAPRQATWIAAHRNDISLNRFEKPYWDRLEQRLQP